MMILSDDYKLKRCPCCGGEARLVEEEHIKIEYATGRDCCEYSSVYALCMDCGLRSKEDVQHVGIAVKLWNTRVND